jgi:hypothetical protein
MHTKNFDEACALPAAVVRVLCVHVPRIVHVNHRAVQSRETVAHRRLAEVEVACQIVHLLR